MRISDWSSDVCSSDLGGKAREQRVDRVLAGRDAADDVRNDVHDMAVELDGIAVGDAHAAADRSAADVVAAEVEQQQMLGAFLGIDRKSVVKGKSVSVSVEFGGRGIIKQKKREYHTVTHQTKQ